MGQSGDEFNANENDDDTTEESSNGKWKKYTLIGTSWE